MLVLNKEKIHRHMKSNGINTQNQLAAKLKMNKSQLSKILSENYSPIKQNVLDLCEILNVSFEDILESSSGMNDSLIEDQMALYFEEFTSGDNFNAKDYESYNFTEVENVVANKEYKVLELFAGAGGLGLGLEKAGFHSVGAVENDKFACQTLRKNRNDWNIIEEDVIQLANKGILNRINIGVGELDLLSGGYPCQAFSYAGRKRGLEDVRGTLFYSYAQILKELMPKIFLAENVKGLVNHDEGKTLSTMLKVFSDIGYSVQWTVLKALNYGTAQKRERIVIIGIRKDLVNQIKSNFQFPKPFGKPQTLKDVLKDVPISQGAKYPESKRKVLELVPAGGYWRDLPVEIAKEYMGKSYYSGGGRTGMARRLSWDEPSLTLTCSPAQKQTERCHPDETRPFTVREYARIQSFPDDWEFDCSLMNAYKQIGNAVPVNLAEAIGKSIVNSLNKISKTQLSEFFFYF